MVQMIPCDSSAIAEYGYDPLQMHLYITPRKRASGPYIYSGFTPDKMEEFLAAGSKGTYWNSVIKPNYQVSSSPVQQHFSISKRTGKRYYSHRDRLGRFAKRSHTAAGSAL